MELKFHTKSNSLITHKMFPTSSNQLLAQKYSDSYNNTSSKFQIKTNKANLSNKLKQESSYLINKLMKKKKFSSNQFHQSSSQSIQKNKELNSNILSKEPSQSYFSQSQRHLSLNQHLRFNSMHQLDLKSNQLQQSQTNQMQSSSNLMQNSQALHQQHEDYEMEISPKVQTKNTKLKKEKSMGASQMSSQKLNFNLSNYFTKQKKPEATKQAFLQSFQEMNFKTPKPSYQQQPNKPSVPQALYLKQNNNNSNSSLDQMQIFDYMFNGSTDDYELNIPNYGIQGRTSNALNVLQKLNEQKNKEKKLNSSQQIGKKFQFSSKYSNINKSNNERKINENNYLDGISPLSPGNNLIIQPILSPVSKKPQYLKFSQTLLKKQQQLIHIQNQQGNLVLNNLNKSKKLEQVINEDTEIECEKILQNHSKIQ